MPGLLRLSIEQHMTQHVEQPGSASVADGLIAVREMRGVQPESQAHRSGIAKGFAILVGLKQFLAIAFENQSDFSRFFRFHHHQRGIIRESLRDPLITVRAPSHQVAPPLMGDFMRQGKAVHRAIQRILAQFRGFFRREESEARQKDQTWPALADTTRHLGQLE